MGNGASSREDRLRALRARYAAELPAKLQSVSEAWAELRGTRDPQTKRPLLHRLAHALAGSAGTFGYPALSEAARHLEGLLSASDDPLSSGQVDASLDALRSAAGLAQAPFELDPVPVAEAVADEAPTIFILEDDPHQGAELVAQLSRFGYVPRLFRDASAALAYAGPAPAAVIADVMLPEGPTAGPAVVEAFRARYGRPIPTVAVSSRFDWASRLAVARAGITSYLVKPVELSSLLERLELLTQQRTEEPFRVVLVEDNELLAVHYSEVLRAVGMSVAVVHEPANLLTTLAEHNPELVLMDLYLPGCTGVEAARVIRQDAGFLAMPIVFLSTEAARQRQLSALHTGADDFLQKPINDVDLVAAVSQRARRFRELRSLLRQDSMTRLLNHVSFKLQLEYELARAERTGSPLSVCMLDLDHFKNVNDTWGHPTGDRVIRSLAQLLRRRLRRSDVSGRYGGEEFAVLLPETTSAQAQPVIDALRVQFAELRQTAGTGEGFAVTFSAGIASFSKGMSAPDLLALADAALYEAKGRGRNQVVLSPPFESSPTRS